MNWTDAGRFCDNLGLSTIIAPAPANVTSSHMNRVEVKLYQDGYDNGCVGEAELFLKGVSIGKISTDDCEECGGACDGVHARVQPKFSVHALLNMDNTEVKEYCTACNIPVTIMNGDTNISAINHMLQKNRVDVYMVNKQGVEKVYLAMLYQDGKMVDTAKMETSAKPVTNLNAQEKQIQEMVDSLLTNSPTVLEEVIKQVTAKRVSAIVDILSTQDPAIVDEVLRRVKNQLYRSVIPSI